MRRRDANSSCVMLGVVVMIAVVFVFNSVRDSAEFVAKLRSSCGGEVTTVTTQVRLIEATTPFDKQPSLREHVMAAFVPPATLECVKNEEVDLSKLKERSVVDKAVHGRAGAAGFHNKSGILDPAQWRPEFKSKRNREMSVWFSYPHKQRSGCATSQPPFQYPGCVVNINHHYKFIWIKGKRVGSTVIREALGWICKDDWLVPHGANKTYCSEQLSDNTEITMEEAQKYWDEYFVFSFVRNPYSRFASGYRYVSSLMGDCPRLVNFGKLCESPFLLAKVCSMLSCCWSGAVTHHLHHAMEQNSCLFTESGHPAVDFIGEMESLSQDLQLVLDEINRRRSLHLPELKLENPTLPKINAQGGERYILELFMSNTTCLERVEHNYWADFERLGYARITASV